MKSLIKIIGALLLLIVFAQNSTAQHGIGGGLTLLIPEGDSEIGINARGTIGIADNMEIVPGINYYIVDGFTLFGSNADFHYLFGEEDAIRFYPLGGLNFMRISAFNSSRSEIQLNIGGGIKLPVGSSLTFYSEAKYILGDFDGLALTAGIMFNIGG